MLLQQNSPHEPSGSERGYAPVDDDQKTNIVMQSSGIADRHLNTVRLDSVLQRIAALGLASSQRTIDTQRTERCRIVP